MTFSFCAPDPSLPSPPCSNALPATCSKDQCDPCQPWLIAFNEWIRRVPALECVLYLATEASAPRHALRRLCTPRLVCANFELICIFVAFDCDAQVLMSLMMLWILFQKKPPKDVSSDALSLHNRTAARP